MVKRVVLKKKVKTVKVKRVLSKAYISKDKSKKGIFINKVPLELYSISFARSLILEPLVLLENSNIPFDTLTISCSVKGGGIFGQSKAIRSSICKAIVDFFPEKKLNNLFKKENKRFISGDKRKKYPKLQLRRGARAKHQLSFR